MSWSQLWLENCFSNKWLNQEQGAREANGKLENMFFTASWQLVKSAGLGILTQQEQTLLPMAGLKRETSSGWTVSGTDNDVVGSVPSILPHSGNFQALFGVGNNSITQRCYYALACTNYPLLGELQDF